MFQLLTCGLCWENHDHAPAATVIKHQSRPMSAGNRVAEDFSNQLDIPQPPAPFTAETFSTSFVWQPSLPAVAVRINATLATPASLAISSRSATIPGSPVVFTVDAGVLSALESELTGSGAAYGEPGEWNQVRFVPRDAFRNIPAIGAVDMASVALEFMPPVTDIKPFTVCITMLLFLSCRGP